MYSHPYPVGLAYTTPADMGRFLLAQLGHGAREGEPGPLAPGLLRRLHAERFTHDASLPGMSYGFFNQTVRGRRALSHGGSASGLDHLFLIVPDQEVGLYFVANGGRSRFGAAVRDSILARLLPGPMPVDRDAPAEVDARVLEAFAGPYQLTRHARSTIEALPFLFATTIYVVADGEGRLRIPHPDGDRIFEPVDSLRFRRVGGDGGLVFRRDPRGRVTHLFTGTPFFGSEMAGAYERRGRFETPYFQNELASWLAGAPLIALVLVWPIAAGVGAWRRRRAGQPRGTAKPASLLALGAAFGFHGLFAVFLFAFLARSVRMFERSTGIVHGMTTDMQTLLAIPWALAVLGPALVGCAALAWRRRFWSGFRRVLYSGLALAALVALGFLIRWNYLPPSW